MEYIFPLITLGVFFCAGLRELYVVRERIAKENVLINHIDPNSDLQFTHPNKQVEVILQKIWISINNYSDREKSKLIEDSRDKYEDIFYKCKNSLSRPTPRSEVCFVPSVLTSMGLLGTFWGIQGALSHLNLNTSKILDSIEPLLDSMKTAFMSSLFGLGLAAFFIVFLAFSTYTQNIYRKYLRKRLLNLNYTPQSDKNVSTELINAAEKMQSLDSESIGIEVGKALTPIFDKILTELKSLREFKADRGQDILEELRDKVITPISIAILNQLRSLAPSWERV